MERTKGAVNERPKTLEDLSNWAEVPTWIKKVYLATVGMQQGNVSAVVRKGMIVRIDTYESELIN